MICCLNPVCNQENPSCPDGTEHCTSCGMQLGLLLDRYRPIRRIGTGKSAVTYLAQDRRAFVNKDCVIKQLSIQNPQSRELCVRESRKLQELGKKTTQIPQLLDYHLDGDYLYLVEWFVEGQNLNKYLERHGIFREEEVINFLAAILPVLELVHKKQVIHRDFKLENIIRRNNGNLVLIDFGVTKQSTGNIFESGTGTPGYTPWEQTEQGIANPASDLYSLGAACFHLLTGKHPYTAFQEHEYEWTNRWREYLPRTIDDRLAKIIDKLLKRNYRDRYQSARNVLKDIDRPVARISFARTNTDLSGDITGSQTSVDRLAAGSIPRNIRSKVGRSSVTLPRDRTWLNFNVLLVGGVLATGVIFYPTIYEQYKLLNPLKAIEDYTEAIKVKPDDPDPYSRRGAARAAMGDKQGAMEDYTQAIDLNPDDADAHFHRGNIHYNSGRKEVAILDYNRSIALNPDNAEVFSQRGNARSALGDKKGAIQDYTQVMNIDPNRIDAYFHRGIDRFNSGDKKGAIEDYTQVIKLDGNRADAYFNRGNTRSAIGDKQGGIDDLTKAIQIEPDRADSYKNRGNARAAIGDKQGAASDYQKVAELSKK